MNLTCYSFETLHRDGEFVLCRGLGNPGMCPDPLSVLALIPVTQHPSPERLRLLEREFSLRGVLDPSWAVRPIALAEYQGRPALVFEDPKAEPLDRLLEGLPDGLSAKPGMELRFFLKLSIGITAALEEAHRRNIIHKDIRPSHIMVDVASDRVWLTGFGIASRLPREREIPRPPESIAGTLAYMAPEQTGRMNRSLDTRCDLYSLGVTLYQTLTGSLPFNAADPMEWVHCQIARQPPLPNERAAHVPPAVAAIIMKLLAKSPEERYQTAVGLKRDLRYCLEQLETKGCIDDFIPGKHDRPDYLLIPEKLYGRQREVETLLAAFDRVVSGDGPGLVLVSGYSGIGKSSLVNELHRALVPSRGLFAAGKFDQYKRDIPYSTLAQAFQDLVRSLLGRSESELSRWRDALLEALDPSGQLIVDLVPELKLIIGDQTPVSPLAPQDAQRRFQLAIRHFVGVFARPEHPLALFLDDLQWLDAATLNVLQDLITQRDVPHLLLIGAYRDNEVTPTHPLMRTLDAIRNMGAALKQIVLSPLTEVDVAQLIEDSLYCGRERAASLAPLVLKKTGGNPFFVIQFLSALAEEDLLVFDHDAECWSWDLAHINARGYTDNVVDLMISKLKRLPLETQKTLQHLACLGISAASAFLVSALNTSQDELANDMAEALRAGLVLFSGGLYRFLHDRVREAAYSLISEVQRPHIHLRIGRLLAADIPREKQEESIFEILSQLNRGSSLVTSQDEREQLAELNLIAGRHAKGSTAYLSALRYLLAAASILPDGWERRPELMFAVELHRAECEFLIGELEPAEARLATLSLAATNSVDRAAVACLRSDLYMTIGRNDLAIDVCLSYLRDVGLQCSPSPTDEEAQREYERIWRLLVGREIEELVDLPLMSEPKWVATLNVLSKAMSPALQTDANLFCMLICHMVNLSIEYGNTDASASAYVHLAAIAGPRFGNYQIGFRFGRLGYDLVEQRGQTRDRARVYLAFAVLVMTWTKSLRIGRELILKAFDASNTSGDVTWAAFCYHNLVGNLLMAGDPLGEVEREAERGLGFARNIGFGLVIDNITTQLMLVRTLRGMTATFGSFDGADFDENQFETRLSSDSRLAFAECWYWTRKLQARYLAGNYAAAVSASMNAQRLLWTSPSFVEMAEAHFYGALSHAAACEPASPSSYTRHFDALTVHYEHLLVWAKNCPGNFENRAALVGAEVARIEGRYLDAERLYEEAIRSAHENDFVHNEAIANELASRFYAARGYETISRAYLGNARYCYLRWGADGKVRQLDQLYSNLVSEEAPPFSITSTIGGLVERLDLATMIEVSQAVSSEIELEKLLDTVMRSAIEHAGAGRALLVLLQEAEQRVVAEATTSTDAIMVQVLDEPVNASMLPERILHYVLRTHESVNLNDSAIENPFSDDTYFNQCHARSVLCLPLTNQGRLIGVLYLENSLAPRVFAPTRTAMLKVIASQAAISIENARLYRDLAKREARIRRLVDANIIGIFIWDLDGRILEANGAFLTMVGYDREDLLACGLRWTDLTPPEWRDSDEELRAKLKMSGILQPFEKEYFRKDGSRVPVLIGVASFEEGGSQGVAYVLDLTERKRAQEALNRADAELERVSRVATLSALTASITHEINQPLSGIITNASTCIRMLDGTPPNIDGARETARRTIRDGNRVSDVITRLRGLFKKREPTFEPLDLNKVAQEVIALLSNDLRRNRIRLKLELTDHLPAVTGDRIQLQQVILNLVRNASDAMADTQHQPRRLLIRTDRQDDGCVAVIVRDNGVGLPPQGFASVFDAFYTTKSGGTGIGLFISRSIIERHHGHLRAEPNEPGPGATFSFSIPCNVEGEPDKPATTYSNE